MQSCGWARPEPLTQLYGGACIVSFAALAVAKACGAQSWMLAKASAPPTVNKSTVRETWVDTTRFVLMVFIVMGHYVAIPCGYIAEQSYWLAPLLVWINLFVMPGFAALSGYLSKGQLTQPRISRLLIFVLFPYIFSKLIYWAWFSVEFHTVGFLDLFDAFSNSLGLEWYLIVLVQWRLAIVLMSPLNKTALFGTALAVGLVSGNWVPSSAPMALERACAFFPFFVAGYLLDVGHIREVVINNTSCKVLLRTIFLGALALFFCSTGISNLFMCNTLGDLNFDYASAVPTDFASSLASRAGPSGLVPVLVPQVRANCGSEWAFSFVHRLVRYQIGAVFLLGLLAWIPSSTPTLAQYGQHTMYPYLLHPWIFQLWLMPMLNRHIMGFVGTLVPFLAGGYVWLAAVFMAPVITLALSTAPVRFLSSPAIEPTWLGSLLLSSEAQPRPVTGKTELKAGMQIPEPKASV